MAKGEELNREERIYISLPDDVDHNGHDVGKVIVIMINPMHWETIFKIIDSDINTHTFMLIYAPA